MSRAHPARHWLGRLLLGAPGLLPPGVLAARLWARPPAPDRFLDSPATVPDAPGQLLRSNPFTRAVPGGARAWRILHTARRPDGAPAVASALVAPEGPLGPCLVQWSRDRLAGRPAPEGCPE